MDGSRTAWELSVSPTCPPNGPASTRCLDSLSCSLSIQTERVADARHRPDPFVVDWPFVANTPAVRWMETVPLCDEDKAISRAATPGGCSGCRPRLTRHVPRSSVLTPAGSAEQRVQGILTGFGGLQIL
jgi:hypothetical protein